MKGHKWLAARPPEPKLQEHLGWVGQLFLFVTQGRGKLRPSVKQADSGEGGQIKMTNDFTKLTDVSYNCTVLKIL